MSNDVCKNSPKWKKPGDVMKNLHLRKKKSLFRSYSTSEIAENTHSDKSCFKQRKNPFAKKRLSSELNQVGKKRIVSVDVPAEPNNSSNSEDIEPSIFTFVEKANIQDDAELDFVYLNEDSFIGLINDNKNDDCENDKVFRKPELPVDWTIKAKARLLFRFMSPSTFAWCARIKGAEEAAAISKATYCRNSEKLQLQAEADFRVELGKSLVYWQHPLIPWFNLFPRFGQDCTLVPVSAEEPSISEHARLALYDSWVVAFRSLHQLLRQGLCPYFYICSQQYTALFRGPSVTHQKQVNCLLSPTSLGFRKALKSQGIAFSTPFRRDKAHSDQPKSGAHNNDVTVQKLKDDGVLTCPFPASRTGDILNDEAAEQDRPLVDKKFIDEDCDDLETYDDDLSWKDISNNLSFRKSKFLITASTEDGLPNTAVLVEGLINTQLLFNYLLNSKSSVTTSGKQSGIPPTVLSPVSFLGATLRKLEFHAGIAKVRTESSRGKLSSTQKHFSLDVSGPIMPHHLSGLVSLLDASQSAGEYSSSFNTYAYTAPFNVSPKADVTSEPEARDCSYLSKFSRSLPPVTMRKMNALNQTYTWEI